MGLEASAPSNGRPATDGGEAAPTEGRAASPQPGAELATPATAARDLPKIAEKADDLEAIKKAVDDAAAVGGGLWLSYLFVLFYLAVAAGAVTHEDLFFERSVKLPFLGVDLPLLAFFFLAPILFIVGHAYTLVHLVFLTEKAKRYHQALPDPKREVDGAARENLQWQLPSNIFIQFLAGPPKLRASAFGWLSRAIGWVTLVIAPILLLILMQVQFLPFHSSSITWTQRIALVVDLALIWWLWGRILSGREVDRGFGLSAWLWPPIGFALSFAVLLFSVTVITFPGEWQEERLPSWPILPALAQWGKPATFGEPVTESFRDWVTNAKRVSLHDWLFNELPDSVSRRRFPFSSTLVLTELNIYEGLGIDDPEKVKSREYVYRAAGRDLRGAIFDLSILPKVDFDSADLRDASLFQAQLQGARLDFARLQGARLDFAQLQGASLGSPPKIGLIGGAQLQGASLWWAQLQGASLDSAQLQGAFLGFANLQAVSLENAYLQGASLSGAQLQGASLESADIRGANFRGAQLLGASMQDTSLVATDLGATRLWRSLGSPRLWDNGVASIRFADSTEAWAPVYQNEDDKAKPWDGAAYELLRRGIESVPAGDLRDQALKRIQDLDCLNPDRTLDSCDPPWAWIPPLKLALHAAAWRKALEAARINDTEYVIALAKVLRDLVCSGDDDAIYVVRGAGVLPAFQNRLEAAGPAAINLISDLMDKGSKDCPVAAALSDADRAKLLQIKQKIEKTGKS